MEEDNAHDSTQNPQLEDYTKGSRLSNESSSGLQNTDTNSAAENVVTWTKGRTLFQSELQKAYSERATGSRNELLAKRSRLSILEWRNNKEDRIYHSFRYQEWDGHGSEVTDLTCEIKNLQHFKTDTHEWDFRAIAEEVVRLVNEPKDEDLHELLI
uniref:Uncharacterized protein n=1 Tax=Kwoniella pini CBS 10737 TaxID=1296096 RepID=A0A1B9HXL9_9TREE|nr:uncharacterized protein I206_05883 [Kwoniella pini CBS 10737]OCF48016.1 hypothetical protein I206_05883 [Kwoniella pini CBS 10737]